ncbi:MAG: inositol monophosphatase family protein [Thermoplasmatota archaeon]
MSDLDTLWTIGMTVASNIREMYPDGGGGRPVGKGADGDWTKEIDQAAERAAMQFVESEDLDWNVISEEMGYVDRNGSKTLIFDPIDGTYNAINGFPFYSTSLALKDETGDISTGVVYDIPLNRCYHAVKGEGAFLDDRPIRTRRYVEADAVFSSFLDHGSMEENRKLLSLPRRGRYFGSISLEVCFVARGALDLFALFSRIPRITDIAAAHLILKEAGGEHLKISGDGAWSPYHPGEEEDIRGIMAFGDPEAVSRMREISGGRPPGEGV